jgi:hypothetical protein
VARKSRLKARRAVSGFLFLAFAGFAAAGIVKLRHDYFLAGAELIGWGCIPLTIVLAITLPVQCKVKTRSGKACKRWAYGFLFGCWDVPDHWKEKFKVRLHLANREERPVARRQPAGSVALRQVAPPSPKPIKVTVEDGFRGTCGFWIGVVSAVASVIQVVAIYVH